MKTTRFPTQLIQFTAGLFLLGVLISACGSGGGAAGGGKGDASSPGISQGAVEQEGRAIGALPPIADGNAADAATAKSAGGASEPASLPLGSATDQRIVQTASLNLQVEDVSQAYERAGSIASAAGGFVSGGKLFSSGEHQLASITLRVPAVRYNDVTSQLRGLAKKVDSETAGANDVTAEYTDLDARRRNLEASEAQLMTLMARANTIGEVLQVQDRLSNVRGQIEQVKGRLLMIEKLTDLATITLQLSPVAAVAKASDGGNSILDRAAEAWDASIEMLSGVVIAVVTAVVFLWWLPLLALPAYATRGLWLRRLAPGQSATAPAREA